MDNVSHTEPSERCPICLSSFEDRAIVLPCGHPFDLKCIRAWLDQSGPNTRNCPLCRRRMMELQYDTPGGSVIEPINPVRPEWPLDDTFSPEIQRRLLHESRERQRLSNWEGLHILGQRSLCLCIYAPQSDSTEIHVDRSIGLSIVQEGLTTKSVFKRELKVGFSEINDMTDDTAADTASLNYAEAAMKELRMTLDRWWNERQNIDVRRVEVTLNSCEISRGRRGITSFLKEKVSIEHCSQETHIQWMMELEERGPANADDDPQIFHPDTQPDTQTPERARADQRIQKAVEQIQGAHEWFLSRGFVDREGPSLERATTNIREVPDTFSLCDFCSVRHRYGDCLMDWSPREPLPE